MPRHHATFDTPGAAHISPTVRFGSARSASAISTFAAVMARGRPPWRPRRASARARSAGEGWAEAASAATFRRPTDPDMAHLVRYQP